MQPVHGERGAVHLPDCSREHVVREDGRVRDVAAVDREAARARNRAHQEPREHGRRVHLRLAHGRVRYVRYVVRDQAEQAPAARPVGQNGAREGVIRNQQLEPVETRRTSDGPYLLVRT